MLICACLTIAVVIEPNTNRVLTNVFLYLPILLNNLTVVRKFSMTNFNYYYKAFDIVII